MENAGDIYDAFKEVHDLLKDTTMTGRIMKAAKKVIELNLGGEILSIDTEGYRIVAEVDDDIYIFFIDWDTEGFPNPEISKADFEKALCDFKELFFENDPEDASIIPGHIALWTHNDRAFVRVTRGVELS